MTGRRRCRDADGLIYEANPSHGGELEVYDRRGGHLGVMDPSGAWIKPRVPGRSTPP